MSCTLDGNERDTLEAHSGWLLVASRKLMSYTLDGNERDTLGPVDEADAIRRVIRVHR